MSRSSSTRTTTTGGNGCSAAAAAAGGAGARRAEGRARNEAGVTVAVECEDVSGVKEGGYFDARRCGFAGTAVCLELVEAEVLEGVGKDRRVGVGVMAEEGHCVVGGCEEVVGEAGIGAGDGGLTAGFRTSDARYCSCKDVSDALSHRRYEHVSIS